MSGPSKTSILFFAILGTFLILSLAFVQPVTARESGQIAVIEEYDKYSSYIESIKEFSEKVSSDERLNSLAKGLTESEDLKNLAEKVFDVKSEEELKALVEEFGKVLEEKEEYQEIKGILERDYKDDIETIKEFADKLKDNPEEIEKILESLMDENSTYEEFGAIPIEAVLFSGKPVHYAIPEKSDVNIESTGSGKGAVQKTAHQLGEDEKTSYTKDAIKRENPSGGVYVNGKKSSIDVMSTSTGLYFMKDLNGNVYVCVWIPGLGAIFLIIGVWFSALTIILLLLAFILTVGGPTMGPISFLIGLISGILGIACGVIALICFGAAWFFSPLPP